MCGIGSHHNKQTTNMSLIARCVGAPLALFDFTKRQEKELERLFNILCGEGMRPRSVARKLLSRHAFRLGHGLRRRGNLLSTTNAKVFNNEKIIKYHKFVFARRTRMLKKLICEDYLKLMRFIKRV
jgi:hypothetical protein